MEEDALIGSCLILLIDCLEMQCAASAAVVAADYAAVSASAVVDDAAVAYFSNISTHSSHSNLKSSIETVFKLKVVL